jgi:hypothetical protein
MNVKQVGKYIIAGDDLHALVVDLKNPSEARYFTKRSWDYANPTALRRAEMWAKPGVAAGGRPLADGWGLSHKNVGDYVVVGNDLVAVAINAGNSGDAHWFVPGTDDPNYPTETYRTAWQKAETWASPGE